jgi:4-methylaminobutanoate oxidase (formaldehyde-forming)
MEKGYRDYGHDIDNTDNVYETGLGFTLDLNKPEGFVGKDKVLEQKANFPMKRRLVQVQILDAEPLMYHAEVVYRNDKMVGYIRAASYGHTLGGAVGLAMIEAGEPCDLKYLQEGKWEVEINNKKYPAKVSLKPLYDPENKKIKC